MCRGRRCRKRCLPRLASARLVPRSGSSAAPPEPKGKAWLDDEQHKHSAQQPPKIRCSVGRARGRGSIGCVKRFTVELTGKALGIEASKVPFAGIDVDSIAPRARADLGFVHAAKLCGAICPAQPVVGGANRKTLANA